MMRVWNNILLALLCTSTISVQAVDMEKKTMIENPQIIIKLPEPKYDGSISLEKAILERRSVRDYKKDPLTLPEISQILWAAQGITGAGYRTAPSAGALYPLEIYIVAGKVDLLPAGIYKYGPRKHELYSVAKGDGRTDLCNAALGQLSIKRAAAVLVISAVYERTSAKYGDRGIRYVHMEAGHAAQNISLQAVALGLGTVVIGAFRDDEVKKVVRMPDDERPLYILPVGKR